MERLRDRLRNKPSRDEQGVVMAWLVQITLVVAVVGIVLFDAGAIAWNYFGVDSTVDEMALKLSETAQGDLTITRPVQEEARRLARDAGVKLLSLKITDGEIHVKIRRVATTITVGKIGAISDWAEAKATGSASTS